MVEMFFHAIREPLALAQLAYFPCLHLSPPLFTSSPILYGFLRGENERGIHRVRFVRHRRRAVNADIARQTPQVPNANTRSSQLSIL